MFQGVIEVQGKFNDVAKSESKYATLLTQEPEQTEEEKQKIIDAIKINRQMSTRVSKLLLHLTKIVRVEQANV